ncbi:hypothetical protein [Parapedobacter sp. DT-150]|uniref:hypothetical protein n=1 Tax=Parapedobacter sp. DT-150 TaxID=3396162 RepID=UPI003F1C98E7
MDRQKKTTPPERVKNEKQKKNEKKQQERKIDEELEQTFPASDPPSYSQPGNDKSGK